MQLTSELKHLPVRHVEKASHGTSLQSGSIVIGRWSCTDDSCLEPGDPGDGGTNADAEVIIDGSTPIDGASPPVDGGTDGATDAPLDAPDDGTLITDGPTAGATGCTGGGALACSGVACEGQAQSCCGVSSSTAQCNPSPTCGGGLTHYCCKDTDCPAGQNCNLLVAGPLPPGPNVPEFKGPRN